MPAAPRPHAAPPELARDILGKLDHARAIVGRARDVARRGGFAATDDRLARLEEDLAHAIAAVEAAVRADTRRLLLARASELADI